MSIYAIGDTHLSFGVNKPMDVFKGWDNYVQRLQTNWLNLVNQSDTVVIPGDISWAMNFDQLKDDFCFLDALPGQKIILKGNHDYWWQTKKKLDEFITQNDFSSIKILFNNAYQIEDFVICGSRGWFFDDCSDHTEKLLNREAGRLRLSIEEGLKLSGNPENLIVFLHYPPITKKQTCEEIVAVLKEYNIKRCYYAHLHGPSLINSVNETIDGISYHLVSADFLQFCPKIINI